MGLLAESRTRRRIQNDPNNTKWTRDTTTFGQKMLRSQGWEPGQFLGAKDAAHSEFHTAANASYIRVSLKDDMKGLGFTKSKEDEVTGLDVFSDLLSRLNGKSEAEVEEKKQARLEVKMHQYVENKFGPMRFVRGGLLVGDAMQENDESKDSSDESDGSSEDEKTPAAAEETKKEKSKKRKAAALKDEDEMSVDDEDDEKKKKKQRKEERRAKKLAKTDSSQSSDSEKARKKEKKDKKEKKKSKKDKALVSEDVTETDDVPTKSSKKDKKDKKEKKEKKDKKDKKSKDRKKRKNDDGSASDTAMPDAAPQASSTSISRSGTATPVTTGTSTPTVRGGFITPRSRFIAQKKAAFMNAQALNQIFMMKA